MTAAAGAVELVGNAAVQAEPIDKSVGNMLAAPSAQRLSTCFQRTYPRRRAALSVNPRPSMFKSSLHAEITARTIVGVGAPKLSTREISNKPL